ncbi:hypothetical protein B0H14DRAFT_3584464 [Mycena olivaceomarginata]|nr:hypothetical protein B0H14DRAFT_3584464 [Mycena olivaceomarginata]
MFPADFDRKGPAKRLVRSQTVTTGLPDWDVVAGWFLLNSFGFGDHAVELNTRCLTVLRLQPGLKAVKLRSSCSKSVRLARDAGWNRYTDSLHSHSLKYGGPSTASLSQRFNINVQAAWHQISVINRVQGTHRTASNTRFRRRLGRGLGYSVNKILHIALVWDPRRTTNLFINIRASSNIPSATPRLAKLATLAAAARAPMAYYLSSPETLGTVFPPLDRVIAVSANSCDPVTFCGYQSDQFFRNYIACRCSTKVLFGIQRRDRRYHETDQDVDQLRASMSTEPRAAIHTRTSTPHGIAGPCLAQRRAGFAIAGKIYVYKPSSFGVRGVQNELILHVSHLVKEN